MQKSRFCQYWYNETRISTLFRDQNYNILLLLFSCILFLPLQANETKADFYISPNGSDQWSGTIATQNTNKTDGPFLTIQRARDAVRKLKKEKKQDILVLLRGGKYSIDKTILFGTEDGGAKQQTITYASYPNESPVFSSGIAVKDWSIASSSTIGLPKASMGKVWVADLPEKLKRKKFYSLFDSKGLLLRARSKQGFIPEKNSSRSTLLIPKNQLKAWSNPADLEVFVRPFNAWITNILPVQKVDQTTGTLKTSIAATYAMTGLHYALKGEGSCWIENAIEELDQPGEWVSDTTQGKIYLWPREEKPNNISLPILREFVRIEGKIDMAGKKDQPVENLLFKGLTFSHGDSYRISKEDAGLQHDWDFFDKDNAIIRLRGSENCAIDQCHFIHTGGSAIRVDLHGKNNIISNNHIEHIGGSGILLCGYGPGTKDVNTNNIIKNNHIHHIGKIYWHSPAIMLWQSGNNRISNNLIHNTPYCGMIISGFMEHFFSKPNARELSKTVRWQDINQSKGDQLTYQQLHPYLHSHDNIIEYNEIHHVMEKLGDGNGIYIRGAGSNNIIRRNYIHHLITPMIMQAAIRTDGGQRDTLISENIIYKCTAQGIICKLNTRCENNYIIDTLGTERDYYVALREGPLTGGTVQKNIFYSTAKNHTFVHLLFPNSKQTEDRKGRTIAKLQDSTVDHNLYFCAGNKKTASKFLKQHQGLNSDKNSIVADPLFIDLNAENFQLKPDSPALKIGIKPIDQTKMGLIK